MYIKYNSELCKTEYISFNVLYALQYIGMYQKYKEIETKKRRNLKKFFAVLLLTTFHNALP